MGIERYKILRSSILVRIESIKIIGMETAYRHMDSPTRREGRISFLGLLGRSNPNDWDNDQIRDAFICALMTMTGY